MQIRTQAHGRHVVVVTIDNQPRLNAMTRAMLAELGRPWDELERGRAAAVHRHPRGGAARPLRPARGARELA
jgi:enoyl-CoA hydratase/carnithine racemase